MVIFIDLVAKPKTEANLSKKRKQATLVNLMDKKKASESKVNNPMAISTHAASSSTVESRPRKTILDHFQFKSVSKPIEKENQEPIVSEKGKGLDETSLSLKNGITEPMEVEVDQENEL